MQKKTPTLSNKIREYRARERITQEELAERAGVTRQTIIAIEKGDYVPSLLLGMLLAQVFHLTTEELFGITKSYPSP